LGDDLPPNSCFKVGMATETSLKVQKGNKFVCIGLFCAGKGSYFRYELLEIFGGDTPSLWKYKRTTSHDTLLFRFVPEPYIVHVQVLAKVDEPIPKIRIRARSALGLPILLQTYTWSADSCVRARDVMKLALEDALRLDRISPNQQIQLKMDGQNIGGRRVLVQGPPSSTPSLGRVTKTMLK